MARLIRIKSNFASIFNERNAINLYVRVQFIPTHNKFNRSSGILQSILSSNIKSIGRSMPPQSAFDYSFYPDPKHNHFQMRGFHFSRSFLDKHESKVKTTVKVIKNKKDSDAQPTKVEGKEPLKTRIWKELVHYYHGFRLTFINIGVSMKLLGRVIQGKKLTRRERRQLVRTTGDIFRLIPFSVFIIVPFMELLLPFYIKFFPGMMPSTFQTAKERETKLKQKLKIKIEMAKFLQETLDDMAVLKRKCKCSESEQFQEFIDKIKNPSETVSKSDIIKYSKYFQNNITLDSLTREQLIAICRILGLFVQPFGGTANYLRFQIQMKLRSLHADDKWIAADGIDSLNLRELQSACSARGMAYNLSEDQLRKQLSDWIELSLNEKVPSVLLLLASALELPHDSSGEEKLKKTIAVLSQKCCEQAKCVIDESGGAADSKTKIEVVKEEQRRIKEERIEEEKLDKATMSMEVSESSDGLEADDRRISSSDADLIYDALDEVCSSQNQLLLERTVVKHLKNEIENYFNDLKELKNLGADSKIEICRSARILSEKVNAMVKKLEGVIDDAEDKSKDFVTPAQIKKVVAICEEVQIEDLIKTLAQMNEKACNGRTKTIEYFVEKIDIEKDGNLKVDNILKVIEAISRDNVNLDEKQFDEILQTLHKEETDISDPCKKEGVPKKSGKSICERLRLPRRSGKKSESC